MLSAPQLAHAGCRAPLGGYRRVDRPNRSPAPLHLRRPGAADRAFSACARRLLTPTDIFPNIDIPVVSVVWTYNGLLPNDMSGRVIYYYERTLTAQVGDIEHIESQSLNGYGVVKIFFQKAVNIAAAMAQVTAASQTVLKLLPPGITPPYVLSYNASSVPILQLALSSKTLPQMKLFDLGAELHPAAARHRAGRGGALALWRQGPAGAGRPRPAGDAGARRFGRGRRQRDLGAEPDPAGRRPEDRQVRLERRAQRQPHCCSTRSTICRSRKSNGTIIYVRDVAFVHRRLAAADQRGPRQRRARRADDDPEGRIGIDARHHRRASRRCCRASSRACRPASICMPWAISRCSSRPPCSA